MLAQPSRASQCMAYSPSSAFMTQKQIDRTAQAACSQKAFCDSQVPRRNRLVGRAKCWAGQMGIPRPDYNRLARFFADAEALYSL